MLGSSQSMGSDIWSEGFIERAGRGRKCGKSGPEQRIMSSQDSFLCLKRPAADITVTYIITSV
jgi:hypothetical protein